MNRQFSFDLAHRVAHERSDFLVAESNAQAVAMIDAWPQWAQPILAIVGDKGSGKTHLAHVWQKQSSACLLDKQLSSQGDETCFLADDLDKNFQAIGEEKLFILLNQIMRGSARSQSLLMTISQMDWWRDIRVADLRSRLAAVPVVEISPPDEQLIGAVLVKLFADRQLHVPASLIDWLLIRMERSFAEAAYIVERLDKESAAYQKPITIALAREVLF